MSAARVEYLSEALEELEEAVDWYLERSPRAAQAFVRELETAVALIASSPHLWPEFEAGARRYPLRKYPFSIIYRETRVSIEVIAVAHQKRLPRYWRTR